MKKLLITLSILAWVLSGFAQPAIPLANWKFTTGDNLEWAQPGFDDSEWKPIKIGIPWEIQGYPDWHNYVWYRIKFRLPSDIKKGAYTDKLLFSLGKIDDRDQTFLNGKLLGQNAQFVSAGSTDSIPDLAQTPWIWSTTRNYEIPATDPRLNWDGENVLAIRVFDLGPLLSYDLPVFVRMKQLGDYLDFNLYSKPLETKPDGVLSKTITLKTREGLPELKGKLSVVVTDEDKKKIALQTFDVNLGKDETAFTIEFKGDFSERMTAVYTLTDTQTGATATSTFEFPYILTPQTAAIPKINGAKVVGVRPGHPFLFRIPATGDRPMAFSAENLPAGLCLDTKTGIITGTADQNGEYTVKITASNIKGKATRDLKIVVGNRIALTPPMGWSSWNCFGLTVSEEKVKASADVFINSGLADHGWTYVNIDDGWSAAGRDAFGHARPNEKFGDMKALTDYIHSLGLKAGLYSSPGPLTCGGFLGSYRYEDIDAKTYADWGFDYLKYDWCSYGNIAKDRSTEEFQAPFRVMGQALANTGRDIVYSLCQYGMTSVWQWGDSVGANAWRTSGDIEDTWGSLKGVGFNQEAGAPYNKPGNWNDPDMLVTGWVGWGPNLHPTQLTPSEQYTEFSLWALYSAPLLIGCDLTRLDDFTLNLLTNDEVIDIDQDPLGKQGTPVIKTNDYQVIVKEIEDGSKAVGLFNLTENDLKISAPWNALQLTGKQKVRDVWRQKDLGVFKDQFESTVPPHGVVLVKVSK